MKKFSSFRLLLVIALLLSLWRCEEQPYDVVRYGSLEGVILSEYDDKPINGVKITTSPTSETVYTDSVGHFSIPEVELGDITVTASRDGYLNYTEKLSITENETRSVSIYLPKDSTSNPADDVIDLKNPLDGSLDQPVNLTFDWHFSATTYKNRPIDVSLVTINTATLEEKTWVAHTADTTYTVQGLKYNTTYLWYLKVEADGTSIGNTQFQRIQTQAVPKNLLVYAKVFNNNYEIFSYDSTTQINYQLTNYPSRDWYPRKSPAEDKVAFVSDRDNSNQIYTMGMDGRNVTKISQLSVTGYNNNGTGFAWSPDGGYIIYPHNNKLIKINKNGYDSQVLATAPAGRDFWYCDWSRYGHKIVVQTAGDNIYDSEIYIMDEDGSNMQLLVANEPGRTDSPTFSFDGNTVYYTHDAGGVDAPDGWEQDARLYQINIDGTNQQEILISQSAGESVYNPHILNAGVGLVYSLGIPDGPKTIHLSYLQNNPDGTISGTNKSVIAGEMPDW
jgi:TolB protein